MVISPGPWIQELTQVTTSDLGITIGCGVTMTQLSLELSNLMGVLPGKYKFSHVLTIEMFNQGLWSTLVDKSLDYIDQKEQGSSSCHSIIFLS